MFYFSESLVNAVYSSEAPYRLGQRIIDPKTGNEFAFVKQVGATTSAVGEIAAAASSGTYGEVSRTAATSLTWNNGTTTTGIPRGVFQSALATNKYGFIQTKGTGRVTLAVTDGAVAAGDPLVIDGAGTPVGAVDTAVAAEALEVFGRATTADSGTTQVAGTYTLNCVW